MILSNICLNYIFNSIQFNSIQFNSIQFNSIQFKFPVGYKRSVEVVDNFSVITSQDHFCVFGTVFGHNVGVESDDFVVNKLIDV